MSDSLNATKAAPDSDAIDDHIMALAPNGSLGQRDERPRKRKSPRRGRATGLPLARKSRSKARLHGDVLHGDCLDVMRGMAAETVKIVVTSPPYNIKNSTGNGLKDGRRGKWPNAALQSGYDGHDDCLPHGEYVAWRRECLTEMLRLLRPDGAIFYNHNGACRTACCRIAPTFCRASPCVKSSFGRDRGGINFNPGYFLPNYEVVYLIAKPAFRLAPKANAAGCVWRINQENDNPHPAPFPVDLAARCIQSVGAGPVLDPFMGSGTTAIAAEQAGVHWIGIEKSAEYVKMARDRLAEFASCSLRRPAYPLPRTTSPSLTSLTGAPPGASRSRSWPARRGADSAPLCAPKRRGCHARSPG